jgi:hypothetical protein
MSALLQRPRVPTKVTQLCAEQGFAGDYLQPTLRSGFRQRLKPGVLAPSKAWRLFPGESPGRGRGSHPPGASLAAMAEWLRRSREQERGAASTASPGGRRGDRAPCRAGTASPWLVRTPRGCTRPTAPRAPPIGRGGAGPPASTGRGMPAERRRRPWAAPTAPAGQGGGGVLAEGKPPASRWGGFSRRVRGGGERPPQGAGRDGSTEPAQDTSAGPCRSGAPDATLPAGQRPPGESRQATPGSGAVSGPRRCPVAGLLGRPAPGGGQRCGRQDSGDGCRRPAGPHRGMGAAPASATLPAQPGPPL